MTDLWDLPFRGDDFHDDERVYWGTDHHGGWPDGVQAHGYDLCGQRFDPATGTWSQHQGVAPTNEDFHLHGKPVYAMQDGLVIAGWRNAPDNPTPLAAGQDPVAHEEITQHEGDTSRIYGGGNHLWVQHADGTRAEYAHLRPGSVPAGLVPHNDTYLPLIASTNVRDAWPHIRVPIGQCSVVRKGQKIGEVGNSGTSSHPHLHIHRETGGTAGATKSGGEPVPIRFSGGLSADMTAAGWRTKWSSFTGEPIPAKPCLIWPPRTRAGEHTRFGMCATDFALVYEHLVNSGLWPEWLDFYSVGGKVFVNHVWRAATQAWRCYWGAEEVVFKEIVEQDRTDGFQPVIAEPVTFGDGAPTYAGVFVAGASEALVRHGISYDEHMAVMAEAQKKGLSPVSIAVVGIDGSRTYTVLYRQGACTNWQIRSQVAEDAYQAELDKQAAAGRRPTYVSQYVLRGKPFLSVVFATPASTERRDRHRLTAPQLQAAHDQSLAEGRGTRILTAFDGARTSHRFAASWWA